jgi:LuxR family transcriptional regulator, maltose regulon positive regulatory protein
MAESRTSSPDQAATRARDELLATKFNIPRTRPDLLGRSRLIQRLDQGMAREVVLVCTPAGFGKSTLLADWAANARWPVAWLSLDPEDNDPMRFWRYVVAALDRVGGGAGEHVLPLLSPLSVMSSRIVVTALVNQLQVAPEELALVLDDYHLIDTGSIHDDMAFLLGHLPPQLHVVITSRSDPPLPLARLRARGQLVELRAADLRFTLEESAALLGEVWGLDLGPGAMVALERRTEGWAVGLQLTALSLRERPDPDAFLGEFTGTHRYVLDYLSEEVLERQPDRVRTFLLESSILERLSGPLCDAVTGDSDSQSMLEELERANLFLIPLDEERRWWRFHHLFADLLRARLGRSEAGQVSELHQRAAAWCDQHGLTDEAIRHALAAGDTTWAARLVEHHLSGTLRRGESVTLQRWLSVLPDGDVRSVPALCLAEGLMELHLGQLDAVERLLEHAERAFAVRAEPQELEVPTDGGMVAEVPAAIALLRAELSSARGDPERTAQFARSALAQLAEEERGPRLWARWVQLLADWMSGQMEKAESGFAQILTEARAAPDPHPLTTSCHTLGWVQQARGRLGAALKTYREGQRLATEGGRFLPFHAGEAHVGIAQVLYARDQLDDALQHVTEGIELTRQVIEFRLPAFGLVNLAWTRQAMGDRDGALEAIDEACRLLPATDVVTMFSPAQTERAGLLLAQGRVDEAARWAEERGLTDEDDISYPWERSYLVLTRVLLARHQPDRAFGLLKRLDALAESQGRVGSLIEIRALRSLALQSAGQHQDALTALAEVLALARPEGYVRVFADEGPPMAALLQRLIRARQPGRAAAASRAAREHLNRVVQAFRSPMGRPEGAAAVAMGPIEPLTKRELEVLGLIAAGRPNQEIADQLVVTLETVKKHTSHIFSKLGAANRTDAVARARQLRLLP